MRVVERAIFHSPPERIAEITVEWTANSSILQSEHLDVPKYQNKKELV